MHRYRHSRMAGIVLAAAGCLGCATGALGAPEPEQPIVEAAKKLLDLSGCTVQQLRFDRTMGVPIFLNVALDGEETVVELRPHTIRAQGYQVLAQVESGEYVDVAPGAERCLRGEVMGRPDTSAGGSLFEEGIYARVILADGRNFWVEPLFGRVAGAQPDDHAVYEGEQVLGASGICGLTDEWAAEHPSEDHDHEQGGAGERGATYCAELACDADVEYYQDYGSSVPNVEARINTIINMMNVQYERDVDITHVITTIIVRTAEPDPYSSNNNNTLLQQFRNHWVANQAGVQRDAAQLFTGRDIAGGVIGQAWTIGSICSNSTSYCFVESDCCGSTACATDLSAHELGHLWNGVHCSCSSPAYTMNPFITCINRFNPSSTIPAIINYRNSRTCLQCPVTGPANNACNSVVLAPAGSTPFTTVGATTDGPSESSCSAQPQNDVWFLYQAPCSGTATISLCGSTFDTVLAVYGPGGTCPTGANTAIACNDDTCQLQSQVVVSVQGLGNYWIRIGGFNGATGTGTLTITPPNCNPPPANNNCGSASSISDGSTNFTTVNATTDGPAHTECLNAGSNTVDNDVWYNYVASCTGTLTVSTCNSATFDTRLAVYSGTSCTGLDQPGRLLGCNDDAAGCGGFTSTLSVPVTAGQAYKVRVGGYNGASGTGTLTIGCVAPNPGACCLPTPGCDPDCGVLLQADCLAAGGTWTSQGIPCVICPEFAACDWNLSGGIDTADFFEFFGGFFASPPDADYDGDGATNTADFFSFFSCFFATPPGSSSGC